MADESFPMGPGGAAGIDPLWVSSCLDCDYDLTGLPAACRCPECGAPYDRAREVVLTGFATGPLADAATEPGARFAKRWAWSLLWAATFCVFNRDRVAWIGLAWLPAALGPGALLVVRARVGARRAARGTVRARLSADGVVQEALVRSAVVAHRWLSAVAVLAFAVAFGPFLASSRVDPGRSSMMVTSLLCLAVSGYLSPLRPGAWLGRLPWWPWARPSPWSGAAPASFEPGVAGTVPAALPGRSDVLPSAAGRCAGRADPGRGRGGAGADRRVVAAADGRRRVGRLSRGRSGGIIVGLVRRRRRSSADGDGPVPNERPCPRCRGSRTVSRRG